MIQQNPITTLRRHLWRDVFIYFSKSAIRDYSYTLHWVGDNRQDTDRRAATVNHGQGLGKSSTDVNRINAMRDKQVLPLIDLDRLLPARNFSNSFKVKMYCRSLRYMKI
jgi:hypothetical protein